MADVKGAKATLASVLEEMVRVETILADQAYKGALAETLEKAHKRSQSFREPNSHL